jgi:hypothetical protein
MNSLEQGMGTFDLAAQLEEKAENSPFAMSNEASCAGIGVER